MKKIFCVVLLLVLSTMSVSAQVDPINLPEPDIHGNISVETAIQNRRSIRTFQDEALTLKQVSQLLWAAGGITVDGVTGPTRAYPSAGGIYPLVIYLVAGKVDGIPAGIYKYRPFSHSLEQVRKGDFREALSEASLGQRMIRKAPVSIVIIALYNKTARRYGNRGVSRYVPMDAGHMGENVHLQAYAMGLGTCMVGAFDDVMIDKIISVEKGTPIYIMPVGKENK